MSSGSIQQREYTRTDRHGNEKTRAVWRARYVDSTGKKHEKTFAKKREAQAWLNPQLTAVQEGSHVAPARGKMPLSKVAERWKAEWPTKDLAPTTIRSYEGSLANHILPRFGNVPIAAITASDVQEWLNDLLVVKERKYRGKDGKLLKRTYGLHPETIHHCASALRSIFKVAVRHKLVTTNPCTADSVTMPSKKVARATAKPQLYLTSDEVHQLANAMPEHWRLATYTAAYLGCRAGELWALRRQDVLLTDLGAHLQIAYALKDVNGELIVGPTKTHQQRKPSIPRPLRPMLAAALAAPGVRLRRVRPDGLHGNAHGYPCIVHDGRRPILDWTDDPEDPTRLLFTTPFGHPVRHLNFLRRVWRPAVDGLWPAGHRLHGLRWHDLRHTCASLSLATGASLHVVKERLGHEDIKTTVNRYGHLLPSVDAALADALGEMFEAAAAKDNVVELRPAESA